MLRSQELAMKNLLSWILLVGCVAGVITSFSVLWENGREGRAKRDLYYQFHSEKQLAKICVDGSRIYSWRDRYWTVSQETVQSLEVCR